MTTSTRVVHIHVSYLPIPKHLGEPKTKPTQLSIRTLMGMGIQPDFLIARCEKEIDARRKYLLSLTCNLRDENIVSVRTYRRFIRCRRSIKAGF